MLISMRVSHSFFKMRCFRTVSLSAFIYSKVDQSIDKNNDFLPNLNFYKSLISIVDGQKRKIQTNRRVIATQKESHDH